MLETEVQGLAQGSLESHTQGDFWEPPPDWGIFFSREGFFWFRILDSRALPADLRKKRDEAVNFLLLFLAIPLPKLPLRTSALLAFCAPEYT